jgi:translation initiation factor IF-3
MSGADATQRAPLFLWGAEGDRRPTGPRQRHSPERRPRVLRPPNQEPKQEVTGIAKKEDNVRVNERIRIPQVRVVDEEGGQVGVMSSYEALKLARERGLDLVEVSPNASPPVCRIMDFGKYKYELSKRAAKAKKVQHRIQVKEVKFRPKIDDHDFDFKVNHARDFLEGKNKVKFTVMFRGREMAHSELGRELLDRAAEALADIAQVENPPRMEGYTMTMYMMPRKDHGKPEKTEKPEKPRKADRPSAQPTDTAS